MPFDDEPWCFTHSPNSGSTVKGYSYKIHGFNVPEDLLYPAPEEQPKERGDGETA